MPRVPVERDAIEAALARYLAQPSDDPPAALEGAERHHVLPLFSDFLGCWAMATSGDLVFFPWDDPEDLELVADTPAEALGTHVALAVGSKRYPELAAMRPERSTHATPCTQCDGSGLIAEAPDSMICVCGGLGWFPAMGKLPMPP